MLELETDMKSKRVNCELQCSKAEFRNPADCANLLQMDDSNCLKNHCQRYQQKWFY